MGVGLVSHIKGHRLKVFDNRVLWRIFGRKKEKIS
jgi:hypothetical protein